MTENLILTIKKPFENIPTNKTPRTIKIINKQLQQSQQQQEKQRKQQEKEEKLKEKNFKEKREKVKMIKPRQLLSLPPSIYQKQCREARIKFEIIKQQKALEEFLKTEKQEALLKKNEEIEKQKERDQKEQLRSLQIKNTAILYCRSCLRQGRKNAYERYLREQERKRKLLNKQIQARNIIVKYWKSSRRYRFYLSFQDFFQQLAYYVELNHREEEKRFQERINQRSQIEMMIERNILKKKEFYQQQLLERKKQIFKLNESNSNHNDDQLKFNLLNTKLTNLLESDIISSDKHLFPWCDENNEYNNSLYNIREYRKWLQKYSIHLPSQNST